MDRRNFIWGLGGFVLGTGMTTAAAFSYRAYRRRVFAASRPPAPGFVEQSGTNSTWLLSAADREVLSGADYPPESDELEIVPNADFFGTPFFRTRVSSVEDCIRACEENTECTRFTFAKLSHPDANKRRICWLKTGSGPVNATGAPDYISGWR